MITSFRELAERRLITLGIKDDGNYINSLRNYFEYARMYFEKIAFLMITKTGLSKWQTKRSKGWLV